MNIKQMILIAFSVSMSVASLYLLNHHFETFFPTGISQGVICNINSFFNCDTVAYSPIASLFSVPIALFGMLAGLFLLLGSILPSVSFEGTNNFLAKVNFVGCILLFLYSILILKHLCPVCTLYYIFSGVVAVLFWKYSEITAPSLKIISIYLAITIAASLITILYVKGKEANRDILANTLIKDYDSYPNLGSPETPSPYRLASAAERFENAPLQLTIFSDFQCPSCELLSKMMEKVIPRYAGKINIQYFFYPLDMACNPEMTRPMHQFACQAAYLASCSGPHFKEVHDQIFAQMETLSDQWLADKAKAIGAYDCMSSSQTKEQVQKQIEAAKPFNVKSTPTFLLNGVKIEGAIPLNQLFILLDELLKRVENAPKQCTSC